MNRKDRITGQGAAIQNEPLRWGLRVALVLALGGMPGCRREAEPGGRAPGPGPGPAKPEDAHATVAVCQGILNAYYRHNPAEEVPVQINEATRAYNDAITLHDAEIKKAKEKLDEQVDSMKDVKERRDQLVDMIDRLKKSSLSPDGVELHNRLVGEANDLAKEHDQRYAAYERGLDGLTQAVARIERDMEAARRQIEDMKAAGRKQVADYVEWHNSDKGLGLFMKVNELYARLEQERTSGRPPAHADGDLEVLRGIRRELGDHTRRRQEKHENGLIIVPATLCGREESWFVVDTGASIVTIPSELLSVLGLSGQTGAVMTVALAGGIRIQGPEVIIPSITVFGKTAEQVKAIVIPPSVPGVDGLLGHSFLNRFDYRVDRTRDPQLSLEPKSGP